jgi:type I restriction enzyme S subunit
MSFPRYPKYKDSGVEWLGEVPEGWVTEKVKYFTRFVGGGTPSRDNPEYWGIDIPWVSPKDMKTEYIIDAEEHITLAGLQHSSTTLIGPGKVMVVVRSGILKHTIPVAINCTEVALNQDMKALCFDDGRCTSLFFMRWVQGLNDDLLLAWAKQGATVESIEHTYLAETIIPLPSVDEQQTIATFLDRETAKIDALVAEQENLIALLKEKRQAVISHAVTKGLDPTVPMKDSGVEWLGEVAVEWEVCNLNHALYAIGDVDHYMPESVDKGVPYVMTGDLTEFASDIDFERCKQVSRNDYLKLSERIKSSKGDIIMARYATIGTGSYIDVDREFLVSYSCVTIKPKPSKALGLYLFHFFKSLAFIQGIQQQVNANTQDNIGIGGLKKIKIMLPNLTEQAEIIEYLAVETAKLDTLTAEAQRAIDLLKERRSALISAAVTGKIDVRGFHAQP